MEQEQNDKKHQKSYKYIYEGDQRFYGCENLNSVFAGICHYDPLTRTVLAGGTFHDYMRRKNGQI